MPLLHYHPGQKARTARAALALLIFACAQFLISLGGIRLMLTSNWAAIGICLILLALLAGAACIFIVGISCLSKVEPEHRPALWLYSILGALLIPTLALAVEAWVGLALWGGYLRL